MLRVVAFGLKHLAGTHPRIRAIQKTIRVTGNSIQMAPTAGFDLRGQLGLMRALECGLNK